MPVSVTVKMNSRFPSEAVPPAVTRTATFPLSVNLTALTMRLMRTCRIRPWSPTTISGISSADGQHLARIDMLVEWQAVVQVNCE